MKLLLTTLNAKYVHSNLALKYLWQEAAARFKHVRLQEFTINNEADYVFCELVQGDYDLACFSCYVWNIEKTLILAENLKKARPRCRLLLGGPEVSFEGERFLKDHPFVDFLIQGEGEAPFSAFLERLELLEQTGDANADFRDWDWGDWDWEDIPALAFRQGDRIRVNPPDPAPRFDATPFPYEGLPWEEDKVVYYESARGCPFRCAYCLSSVEKDVRPLPMERVKRELDYLIRKRPRQVKFIDRTFNYDRRRCNEILGFLMEKDNGFTNFHLEICGELLEEETLRLLSGARPGLFQMEIGVQSTNPDTLESINRGGDFARLAENVGRLKAMGGIHLHLDLIAGLPYEDYLSFQNSFDDVYRLRPHQLQLGFLKLLKGSPLREKAAYYRYEFRRTAPYEVISNAFLSAGGLVRLKMAEAVLDLYFNRGGFAKSLERAAFVLYQSPFAFYQELGDFYYLKGFQHKSHKKEDLYRILRQFFTWKYRRDRGQEALVFELLEEDLRDAMNPDAVKKFEKKGWELD